MLGLGLGLPQYLLRRGATDPIWTPAALFAQGQQGAWYEPKPQYLYQDAAGTVPVTADGDPVGRMLDQSPNSIDATQAVSTSRPTYAVTPSRVTLDGVDDNMTMDFTGSGGFQATRIDGTRDGCIVTIVNVPDGQYSLVASPTYPGPGNFTGVIVAEGVAPSDQHAAVQWLQDNGSGDNFAGVTSMAAWFMQRTDVVEIDVSNWDTSSVTDFLYFAYGASSLTTLDVSNWNTSSVTNFRFFAILASSLTTVTVNGGTGNPFADSPCIRYDNAFANTNLTQQSIDDILVAINSANTANGRFDQSGGSAPSATGEAAIDALRARGWTITVTGGY